MSSKSRGRHRFAQDAEREAAAEEKKSRWAEVSDAFERANTRSGLRDLVGLMLKDREEQLAPDKPEPAKPAPDPQPRRGDVVREPTQYERSILHALGSRHVYPGTVEPWRIEQRRRRNRAARAARRRNRLAARR